jgi:hypothetical protein
MKPFNDVYLLSSKYPIRQKQLVSLLLSVFSDHRIASDAQKFVRELTKRDHEKLKPRFQSGVLCNNITSGKNFYTELSKFQLYLV